MAFLVKLYLSAISLVNFDCGGKFLALSILVLVLTVYKAEAFAFIYDFHLRCI